MIRTVQFSAVILLAFANVACAQDRILFSFDAPESAKPWQIVNDGVMGGRSTSKFKINKDQKMEFSGILSLENNGGFASTRARKGQLGLEQGDSIVIRVRGDGREYNFNLYAQNNLGGYSYRQSFKTKQGEWVEAKLPLDKFVATWRGRVFRNQKLDLTQVAGMGILLGDKKAGRFKLEVEWIKAVSP